MQLKNFLLSFFLTISSFPSIKSQIDTSDFQVVTIELKIPTEIEKESKNDFSKIIRGESASNGQFPFAAYLHIRRGSATTFCTGSLIASNWIITTRNCFVINQNQPADSLQAFLGSNDNQNPSRVNSFANRGAYFNNANGINPNFALFRLKNHMPTTSFIRTVRLPRLADENFGFDDFNVTTVGWGRLADGTFPRILQFGRFRILAIHLCRWSQQFSSFDFCSQHQNLTSMVADRDFGGASIITENDGQMTLIGVTSTIFTLPNGNAVSSVRISSFLRFINQQTGIPFR